MTGPDVTLDGVRAGVDTSGEPGLDRAPGFALMTCADHYTGLYGDVICGLDDPWEVRSETWSITWEGAIIGANGGRGRLATASDGSLSLVGEVPFCDRGVLGGANVASLGAGEPEAGYAGDLLVITGGPPPAPPETDTSADAELRRACEAVFGEDGAIDLVDVPILQSSQSTLALGAPRFDLSAASSVLGPLTGMSKTEVLMACFPELVTYEVHVQNAYAVFGSRTGTPHRIMAGATPEDACAVDVSQDPRNVSRAFHGRTFDNGLLSFQLVPRAPGFPSRSDSLFYTFVVGDLPSLVAIRAGSILSDLRFSTVKQSLYSVDVGGSDGLVQIKVQPFEREVGFE